MLTLPTDQRKAHPTLRLSSGFHNSPPAAAVLAGSTCPAAVVRIPVVRTVPVVAHIVLPVAHTVLAVGHRVPDLVRRGSVMRRSSRWEAQGSCRSRGPGVGMDRHRGGWVGVIGGRRAVRQRERPRTVSRVWMREVDRHTNLLDAMMSLCLIEGVVEEEYEQG